MMPTAGSSAASPVPTLGSSSMIPGLPVARVGSDNPDSIPTPWGEQIIPAIPPRPSAHNTQQSNAAIVAAHAAAAAAAVAAASAPTTLGNVNLPAPGATNPNQADSNGVASQPNSNGHVEDEAIRAAQMKRRKQILDECVERNRANYRHPKGSQEETIIFHRARALLEITNLSQTFICQRATITNAALSQYLRACFKGRQDTLEDKLEVFIIEYLEGKYDGDARRNPAGRRKSDASGGPSRRYSNPAALSHMSPPNGNQAGILSYQHRMAQQHLIQQQQQALLRQHQQQPQHNQYAAAAAAAAAGSRVQYNAGAADHYANQRVAGNYNRQYQQAYNTQQQYALQQHLLRQQQQQQQAYQNQLALRYRQTQVAAATAAAAAQNAAPALKPLPPTVAVEKAFHAYQSANLDITSTNNEPLLVSIEINVQLEDGEGLEVADVHESEDASMSDSNPKDKEANAEKTKEANGKELGKDGDLKDASGAQPGEKEQGVAGKVNGSKAMEVEPDASVGLEIVDQVLKVVEKEKPAVNGAEKENSSEGSDSSKVKDDSDEKDGGKGNGHIETSEKNNANDNAPKKAENGEDEGRSHVEVEAKSKESTASEKAKEAEFSANGDVEMKGDDKGAERIDQDGDVNMDDKAGEEIKDGSTSPSKRVRAGTEASNKEAESNPAVPVSGSGESDAVPPENGAADKEGEGNTAGSEKSAEVPAKPLLRKLRYHTQWDVNERRLSPEEVAEEIVKANKCHPALASKVAFSIRRQLLDVGVTCAVPPSEREKENLRKIWIRVPIKGDDDTEEGVIEDKFDWDICMGEYNSAELFAQHICSDNGVSQYHVPQVAQAIRKQVMLAQAVSYGDKETAEKAKKIMIEDNHPLLGEKLERLIHGVRRLSEGEKRELRENCVHELIIEPLFERISDEIDIRERENLQKRIAAAKHEEEERVRQEIEKKKRRDNDAENSKLTKKIMADADKWSGELGARLDPYLEFRLGKGNIAASVWVEGMLIRKKHGHRIMPAVPDDELKLVEAPKKRKGTKGKGTGRGRGRPRKNPLPPQADAGDGNTNSNSNSNSTTPSGKKPERKRRSSTRNAGSASKRTRRQ